VYKSMFMTKEDREREAEKAADMAKGEMLKRMDFLED